MKQKNDKEMLDSIGRTLVQRSSVSEQELDAILSRSDLFAGVMKKIGNAPVAPTVGRRLTLGMGVAYASVSMVVAVVATITAMTFLRTGDAPKASVEIPAAPPEMLVTRPDSPPQDVPEVKAQTTAGRPDQRMTIAATEASYNAPRKASVQHAARPNASVDDPDFYPVSYTGDSDALAGGRIVRVDLPRAQAFAMGLRVPLENESETVKADLVIGPDGVPRAVRLVR